MRDYMAARGPDFAESGLRRIAELAWGIGGCPSSICRSVVPNRCKQLTEGWS